MRRGTIILLLFILIAGGVIALSQFLRAQPPLELTLAVNPLLQAWVNDAVRDFNNSEPTVGVANQRIHVTLNVLDDLDVWASTRLWTTDNHPDAWLPASSVSVTYALENGMTLRTVADSLAQTPLVWGGYVSRVDILTDGSLPLDWDVVAEAAATDGGSWARLGGQSGWQFLKLAFPQPNRTMSGLGVLLTGAAAFNDSPDLSGGATRSNDFHDWLEPVVDSVPNFSTLGGNPAAAMARGPSTVEIAMFPESEWLTNLGGMTSNEPVRLNYPEYQFLLDFPLAAWQDTRTTPDQTAAVDILSAWLLNETQQSRAVTFGLRPASGQLDEAASLFVNAEQYGIQLNPTYNLLVQPPARGDAQGLIQWFISNL